MGSIQKVPDHWSEQTLLQRIGRRRRRKYARCCPANARGGINYRQEPGTEVSRWSNDLTSGYSKLAAGQLNCCAGQTGCVQCQCCEIVGAEGPVMRLHAETKAHEITLPHLACADDRQLTIAKPAEYSNPLWWHARGSHSRQRFVPPL